MSARETRRLPGARWWGIVALVLGCAGPAQAQPVPMQDLALVDQHGRALQPALLAGRPVLLHFVYTACGTSCPLQLQELAALQDSLAPEVRGRLQIVSMTVDPLSDTPRQMLAFAQRLGLAARAGWHFGSGRPEQVHRLIDRMQALGPAQQRRAVEDHRTSLYLFGTDGQLVQRYRGSPVDRARLNEEITRLARRSPA